ncbi:cell division protein FtsZ [Geobacter pelophilus]|jgi:cell division protein FtsZ|uniref:Cell division protein FtsZ n=1 Tax=Geoanaerobacter pelophilus TaxID=60036 RepID=A0AAW4KZ03_9BACT|nr:cell division protein FtsZ [Geoanaerobacter pelophilus]MBT0663793.1 cell division protein FtsZ [Geoanaerobacter pelophilus]
MFVFDETIDQNAKIKVIGIGGGGGNAVNTMITQKMHGVDFIVANTDAQALRTSLAPTKIQLGGQLTKGLGAGANPAVGRDAALEEKERLAETLQGADMIFIAAGMGGGTGTGAAPIIAETARQVGALTVGVVTKPFSREGKQRLAKAEEGIKELKQHVDSLIVIPNDRLLGLAGKSMSILDAFKPSDDVLRQAVQGISDLITTHGMINVDFADVRAIMSERGMAMMGIGIATGENRAVEAATRAISSPLLEDIDISGAKGVLVNISGSASMTMEEFDAASRVIHEKVHDDANIIIGLLIDETLGDSIKITAIATGFGDRFDVEKSRQEVRKVSPLVSRRDDRERPAFERLREREVTPRQSSFLADDFDEQYDIPTFLRKSVD